MDFTSLKQLGRLEKDVTLGGTVFKVTTLTQGQQEKAMSRIPTTVTDDNMRMVFGQVAILSEAIASINSQPVTERDALFSSLKDMQYRLVDSLFTSYMELVAEQGTVLEELKKN